MKDLLSPSIMCADLLNLEKEINRLQEANVELIHFDIMDTTFTNQTMLPPRIIPEIQKITNIPLDIHVMIDKPERILDNLLPYCKGNYVEIHVEVTKEILSILQQIKDAGGKPAVVLNSGTPLSLLEEILPHVEMVNLILGNAGFCPRQPFDDPLLNKVKNLRKMIDESVNPNIILEVDGGVSFEKAKLAKEMGANAFVLGTSAVYIPGKSVVEECDKFREYLK